jgi:O-antigen ligase
MLRGSPLLIVVFAVLLCLTLGLGLLVSRASYTVSIGVLAGIIIFILSFVSTEIAIYVLIFATLLSPEFGSRETHGGGVTLRTEDFLLVLIGFSQLARSALYKDVGLFRSTPLNRPIVYYVLACVFATGLGIMFGRVRSPLAGSFFVLKYVEYYIVYFMVINNLHTKRQAKQYLAAILLTCAIVSVVALAQIPSGERIAAPFEGESGEPNTLGGYLLLIFAVVMSLFLCSRAEDSQVYKLSLLALCGLIFIPILFTQSRATWMAIVPTYIALLILSPKRLFLLGTLAFVVAVGSLTLPKVVQERARYTFMREQHKDAQKLQETIGGITLDTSSSARVRMWRAAFRDFPRHPIFGYGVTGWKFIDAQFLRTLLETGLVGLAAFLYLLWAIYRETWRVYRTAKDPFFRSVAMGFLVGVVAMTTHALTANTFIIVRIMEPFWLLAGIVIVTPELEAEEAKAAPEPQDEKKPWRLSRRLTAAR